MTQIDVVKQLLDGKWHCHKDIMTHNGKNIPRMYKRGELCKRKLFIPAPREDRSNKSRGLKITPITQYRLHPEWLQFYRRKYGHE